MPRALSSQNLKDAQWLIDARTQTVFNAIRQAGHSARVVGGAVRNALLGQPVNDLDIATTATPDEILVAAKRSDLKAVPTGYDHGTITIVVDGTPFEVTTLRQDLETDGRRARVAFTDSWVEDAHRRDFTINAIYCDQDGTLYDPVGGLDDIEHHRVRFIGNADDRIQEDVLRILRFFRFSASYGKGACDPSGVASCHKLRAGLDQLSGERIAAELKKLLVAPDVAQVVDVMSVEQILAQLFQPVVDVARLQRLIKIDAFQNLPGDPVQRLAALCIHTIDDATWLRDRLRLSSHDFSQLATMAKFADCPTPENTIHDAHTYIYRHGADAFRNCLGLAWSASTASVTDPTWRAHYQIAECWQPPVFPVTGDDVLALGVKPGPRVGALLSQIEQWWLDNRFQASAGDLKHRLAEAVKVTKS